MSKFCLVIALIWAIPTFANDYRAIVDEGMNLSPTDAEALEKKLLQNPEDLTARAHVIGYYYLHPAGSSRQSRVRHIGWFIEHHPDSEILRHPAATMIAADFRQPSPADLPTMVAAWQRQVTAHGDDARVFENALTGVGRVDYALAADCLKRLHGIEPTNPAWPIRLGTFYTIALGLGGGANPWAEFTEKAKSDLLESSDLAIVGISGQMIRLAAKRKQAPPEMVALGQTLLDKATTLDPQNPRWYQREGDRPLAWTERDLWPAGAVPPMVVPVEAVRVAPEVESARLLSHEDARCLPGSCPNGGIFRLGAVIGKDGSVKTLYANAGDATTIQMAMEAARHWSYAPLLINEKPVEVATEIDVPMTPAKLVIPPTTTGPSVDRPNTAINGKAGSFSDGAFRVGGGVTQPAVTYKVDPVYSEEARKAKLSGTVLLQLVVDVDGKAKNITVIKGIGLGLNEKAIEAVQKWTFLPGKKDGKPVPVFATVEINFRLLVDPPAPTPPPL